MKLKDLLADINPDKVIAIGGKTAYQYIGAKKHLNLFLKYTHKITILNAKVVYTYNQTESDFAKVIIVDIEDSNKKSFWTQAECYGYLVEIMEKTRRK